MKTEKTPAVFNGNIRTGKDDFIDLKLGSFSGVHTLIFCMDTKKESGRLYLDDNGKLSFKGDVNDSAEVLFQHVCKLFNKND